MSTVAEKPMVQDIPEVPQFFPPKIQVGQQVLYYANAERRNPVLAVVTKTGQSTIECVCGVHNGKYSVHHIDDPGLKDSVEWRSFGAWDITDDAKMLAKVLDRLAAIESQFAAMKADKARQQDAKK